MVQAENEIFLVSQRTIVTKSNLIPVENPVSTDDLEVLEEAIAKISHDSLLETGLETTLIASPSSVNIPIQQETISIILQEIPGNCSSSSTPVEVAKVSVHKKKWLHVKGKENIIPGHWISSIEIGDQVGKKRL